MFLGSLSIGVIVALTSSFPSMIAGYRDSPGAILTVIAGVMADISIHFLNRSSNVMTDGLVKSQKLTIFLFLYVIITIM